MKNSAAAAMQFKLPAAAASLDEARLPPDTVVRDRHAPDKLRDPVPAFTIFHEPWWLETATNGHRHQAELHQGGEVVGVMPYMLDQKFGCDISIMPPLTRALGPVVKLDGCKASSEFKRRYEITRQLVQSIPRLPCSTRSSIR